MPEHQQIQRSKNPESSPQRRQILTNQANIPSPASIIQRARINPNSLTSADVLQLQRTIGNRAVGKLLSEIRSPSTVQQVQIQRQEIHEEEEPLQTKRENNTGMPDNLKAGVESLFGIDMSDVRVHYNSSKPAEVGALAYTQGRDIQVAQGQEKHLPHEAWHVVQQAQGRVKPTMQLKGAAVNDDVGLEQEADRMSNRIIGQIQDGSPYSIKSQHNRSQSLYKKCHPMNRLTIQRTLNTKGIRKTVNDYKDSTVSDLISDKEKLLKLEILIKMDEYNLAERKTLDNQEKFHKKVECLDFIEHAVYDWFSKHEDDDNHPDRKIMFEILGRPLI